jgi:hypothetical protein
MMDRTVDNIKITNNLRVQLCYDSDPETPEDDLVKITYGKHSRYTLGTDPVDEEEMQEIGEKIEAGLYVGWPVYAYVHSGATIRCGNGNPFSCPWDSGMSGYAYMHLADALKEFSDPTKTKEEVIQAALNYVRGVVETFDQYLTGDVYGFIVQTREDDDSDWEDMDSCWGFFGHEYAKEEAISAARYQLDAEISQIAHDAEAAAHEHQERTFWNERDVVTQ